MSEVITNRPDRVYCSGSTTPGKTPTPTEFQARDPQNLRKVSPVIRAVFQAIFRVIFFTPVLLVIFLSDIAIFLPVWCAKKAFIFLKKKVENWVLPDFNIGNGLFWGVKL